MKKFIAALMLSGVTLLAGGLVLQTAASAHGGGDDHSKVTICHHTASKTNPYVRITVDEASILQGGHGHHGINRGDIIPPFTFDGVHFPGQGDQSILANGCRVPQPTTTTEPPTTTPPTTTPPTTQPPCEEDCTPPTTVPPVTTTVPPVTTTAPPSTTTTAPPVTPTTAAPKAPHSPSAPVTLPTTPASSSLPLTGPGPFFWVMVGVGGWLILSGGAAMLWARRFGHRS